MRRPAKIGEIRHEGGRLIRGLNGKVRKIGLHLQVLILEKEITREGKKRTSRRRGKKNPLLVESSTYY
jgi:hypothetical protein